MVTAALATTLDELSRQAGPKTPLRFQIPGVFGAPDLGQRSGFGLGALAAPALKDPKAIAFDTLGWDTVYAVQASRVNACFAQPDSYPTAFQETMTGSMADVTLMYGPAARCKKISTTWR
jgi:hypothetical protein